jgi:hypothetical protein
MFITVNAAFVFIIADDHCITVSKVEGHPANLAILLHQFGPWTISINLPIDAYKIMH